ncbi:two-component system regulatory protein YycI [Agrilactobacillus yilanensis]|uniref:Two-component system regulatory protein YycI n=1 Tax=Agrilactobacillus yilanensis TaxID=2485997 RepID=A0ABW4J6Z7_9LACO|nr:two-component system regulatory protein YycI [Agrilactobacillus yilanensis]
MDFKRLELILLAVFVALDIFLFVSYNQNQNVFFATDVSQSTTESLRQDMKDDDITIPNKLSNKAQSGYYLASRSNEKLSNQSGRLTGQNFNVNSDGELTSRFYQPVDYKKGQALTAAKALLKEHNRILYGHSYKYVPELSNSSQLVFTQKHNGHPVFDVKARLIFQLDDNTITGYTQQYVDNFIVLREKNTVISAKAAINNLYTNSEIPTNSTVVWYRLAYYGFLDAKGSTIYIPTWYIGVKDNSTKTVTQKQINGFTGALIKSKSSESTYYAVDD